jgi:blue light- and temperature-responsive anti-repressor
MEMLYSSLYLSKATQKFTGNQINKLVQQANMHNEKAGITGFLCYQKGYFVQYIEGEKQQLELLVESIKSDDRHEILILLENPIKSVRFKDWGMKILRNVIYRKLDMCGFIMEELSMLRDRAVISEQTKDAMWDNVEVIAKYYNFLAEQKAV